MTREQPDATRRMVVTGGLATAALAIAPSPTGPSPLLSGFVFHDRRGSGVREAGDPGLPGVLVSNGTDVVITDRNGHWQLPARRGDIVFVVKPTDWCAPLGANGLPATWRLIDGEALIDGVAFALRPAVEPRTFDVALLADTQPQTMLELSYLRDSILPAVMETGAAFALNHGDVVFDNPDLHTRYLDLVAASGMPWHHCPGNHDMDHAATSNDTCFATWKRVFGPCHYAFQHGGATFILLNNVERLANGELTTSGYDYRGRIGASQLAFVKRVLGHVPHDALVVVSMHIPLVGFEDPHDPSGHTADRTELLQMLSGRPNTLSLAGHTHTTEHHYLGANDGFSGPGLHHHHVLTAACGSWWSGPFNAAGLPLADSRDGSPKGFHVLSVDNARYTTRFVPVDHAGHPQMRVSLETEERLMASQDDPAMKSRTSGTLSIEQSRRTCLLVNVFDGGPRTSVTCRFRAAARGARTQAAHLLQLERTNAVDPSTAQTYRRHRKELKPWVEASASSHLWRARLPTGLEPGPYTAEITARDEYDRLHTTRVMFEVTR